MDEREIASGAKVFAMTKGRLGGTLLWITTFLSYSLIML
jgi:hypothetical protein